MNSIKDIPFNTNALLKTVVVLLSLYFGYEILSFLIVDYPFNSYEPEVILDTWAVSYGQELYPARQIGPIAGLYAPFYHMITALFFQILPNSISTGRFVSILSLFGMIFIIWKSIKSFPKAFIFSAFSILIWHQTLLNFDMHAKPDSFSVFMGFLSAYILLKNSTLRMNDIFLSALFSSLAIITKQSMAFAPVGIGLYFLIHREWKKMVQFAFGAILISGILWITFSKLLGSDFFYFIFVQPGKFQMHWAGTVLNFWFIQNSFLWILLILLFPLLWVNRWIQKKHILLICITLVALPASVLTASKGGGMANAYQPFLYFFSWLIVSILNENWEKGFNLKSWFEQFPNAANWFLSVLILFTAMPNFPSILLSAPQRYQTYVNYNQLAEDIRSANGTVYCPNDNYITLKAGKPLRWSFKWFIEAQLTKEFYPKKDYATIANESNYLVLIKKDGQFLNPKLKKLVQSGRFELQKEYKMMPGTTYELYQNSKTKTQH